MNGYIKVYDYPESGVPTNTLDPSDIRSIEAESFSWDSTLTIPEDPFFDVESIITITDDLMSGELQESPNISSNPQHREDFGALVATAVKGKKAGA